MARVKAKEIGFELTAPNAKSVYISGDFNKWAKTSLPMKRVRDGMWSAKSTLTPGRYEYKFIVDGQWWTDPKSSENITNKFGSQNSVLTVK